jgi:serine/threonine-protein kinase
VPDVALTLLDDATARITEAGFVLGTVTTEYSPSVEANVVIRSDPAVGIELGAGESVNLVISNGKVQVPNVVGSSIQKAKELLEGPTVQYTVTVQTDTSCTGAVVKSQSIRAGDGPQHQAITVVYCAG